MDVSGSLTRATCEYFCCVTVVLPADAAASLGLTILLLLPSHFSSPTCFPVAHLFGDLGTMLMLFSRLSRHEVLACGALSMGD